MKLKSLLVSALMTLATSSVWANDYTPATVAMNGGPVHWSIAFGTSHMDGLDFTDTYTFSYSGLPGTVQGFFASFASSGGDLDFTDASINGMTLPLLNGPGGYSGTLLFSAPVDGLVTLTISGTDQGVGSYSGTLDVTSPVPEPDAAAMLLGGLALLGSVAWRRRS